MNLKQLQFMVHVATTQSFSRAAELSFATQPTLSNAISQLEEELGGRLFKRTTRSVELTPFGEHMLPRIQELLQSKEDIYKAAEAFHNPSHKILRIGFSPLVDMQRLDQVLTPFRQTHPEVTLFFKECFIDDLAQRLENQQIDIQITPESTATDDPCSCFFYQDQLCYLPSRDDQSDNSRLAYTLSDLPETPIILTGGGCGLNAALESLFHAEGKAFNVYPGQAMSYQVIEDWASLGIGSGILPRSKLSAGHTDHFPLFTAKEFPAHFTFNWRWRQHDQQPAHLLDLISYIETTVPSLVQGQASQQS